MTEEQAASLVERGGMGTVLSDGRISAPDTDALQRQLSAAVAKGVQVSEHREQILNSGLSETERQSLSIYRTAEMVDGLWQRIKSDETVKTNEPDSGSIFARIFGG
jgi:hypothetical protein